MTGDEQFTTDDAAEILRYNDETLMSKYEEAELVGISKMYNRALGLMVMIDDQFEDEIDHDEQFEELLWAFIDQCKAEARDRLNESNINLEDAEAEL